MDRTTPPGLRGDEAGYRCCRSWGSRSSRPIAAGDHLRGAGICQSIAARRRTPPFDAAVRVHRHDAVADLVRPGEARTRPWQASLQRSAPMGSSRVHRLAVTGVELQLSAPVTTRPRPSARQVHRRRLRCTSKRRAPVSRSKSRSDPGCGLEPKRLDETATASAPASAHASNTATTESRWDRASIRIGNARRSEGGAPRAPTRGASEPLEAGRIPCVRRIVRSGALKWLHFSRRGSGGTRNCPICSDHYIIASLAVVDT